METMQSSLLLLPISERNPRESNHPTMSETPRLKCYCTALSARTWKLYHGSVPCDGSICTFEREQAERNRC